MALIGTLEDFGIAEILQLIGQQGKTGELLVENRGERVHVLMSDGNVVSAEKAGRARPDRLGERLVRAGLLARADLDTALQVQRRTLRRLGDVLVELRLVTPGVLKTMAALQTSETLFRLFGWKRGKYAFEPGPVEWDRATMTPIRAEAVLMEGFRQIDEWPIVRRRITSPQMTFERRDPPPGAVRLGPRELAVLALIEPGRTVEALVDRSCLGRFETSKALLALVDAGSLEAIPPSPLGRAAGLRVRARTWARRGWRAGVQLVATAALAAVLAGLGSLAAERARAAELDGARGRVEPAARRFASRAQRVRLESALAVFVAERGEYPVALASLVEAGLASPADLSAPFAEPWWYRREASGGYVLLPPLP